MAIGKVAKKQAYSDHPKDHKIEWVGFFEIIINNTIT